MEGGMNRILSGVRIMGVFTVVSVVGCSSYHHHGMLGVSKDNAYWQKGHQDMVALIDRTVENPDRAKQVNGIIGEIIDHLKARRERERVYHRQLYTLNVSYTAPPEEFTKILDEANSHRMQTSATILGLRFKMKELMTADEWKVLTDQMLSYSGRYQHGGAGAKTGY